MKNNITGKVLEAIDEKHIKPRARWKFLVKNYSVWAVGIATLVIGGLTVSVVGYMMINNDWDLYRQADGFWSTFFLSLPYLWLLSLVGLVVVVYYDIKHTRRGYTLSLYKIIFVTVLASLVLGLVFYGLGFGEVVDRTFSEKLPQYHRLFNPRENILMSPEKGLLMGRVIGVDSQIKFTILDPNSQSWVVFANDADIRPQIIIEPQIKVGLAGQIIKPGIFEARVIKPFLKGGCHRNILFMEPLNRCNERK